MIYETDEIKALVKKGELPQITEENYHSKECDKAYMSFHTWAAFHGTLGVPQCEARAIAEQYKSEHPEMFVSKGDRKGLLQKKYIICDTMIERCKKDELFMDSISGEHQAILVCMLCGVPFKCKIDSLVRGKAIVDLKTTREMHKQFYIPDFGHVDFISYYGYVYQLAFYREAVKQLFDETLPCFIAPVSKSEYPEIKLVHIDDVSLFDAWTEIENSFENGSIVEVWKGNIEPIRCNKPECHYCMSTEVLTEPINYKDLIMM